MERPKSQSIWWLSKRGQRLLLAAALAVALIGASCAFLRISHPRDIEAFLGMAAECPPVWKQFAFRRYGAGDSAQELFRRFPPTRRTEFGRYGVYSFSAGPSNSIPFTSLSVVTRDGKLLSAASGSCTWQFTFFGSADRELDRQYAAFEQARHHKLEQSRLQGLEAELQKFYDQHDRWPTNEAEFGWFVTGEKPPTEAASVAEENRSSEKPPTEASVAEYRFRTRYGLGKRGLAALSTNPLGITFKFREDGALTIALNGEPDLVGTVPKPSR